MGHGLGQDAAGTFDAPILQIVDEQSGRSPMEIGGGDAEATVQQLIGNRSEPVAAFPTKPRTRPLPTSKTNHPPKVRGGWDKDQFEAASFKLEA